MPKLSNNVFYHGSNSMVVFSVPNVIDDSLFVSADQTILRVITKSDYLREIGRMDLVNAVLITEKVYELSISRKINAYNDYDNDLFKVLQNWYHRKNRSFPFVTIRVIVYFRRSLRN